MSSLTTQYNEWRGTIAFDRRQNTTISAELDLDPKWLIVGFSLHWEFDPPVLFAYAVERDRVSGSNSIQDLAAQNDGILPITKISVQNPPDLIDFLSRCFSQLTIRADDRAIHEPGFRLKVIANVED